MNINNFNEIHEKNRGIPNSKTQENQGGKKQLEGVRLA